MIVSSIYRSARAAVAYLDWCQQLIDPALAPVKPSLIVTSDLWLVEQD